MKIDKKTVKKLFFDNISMENERRIDYNVYSDFLIILFM